MLDKQSDLTKVQYSGAPIKAEWSVQGVSRSLKGVKYLVTIRKRSQVLDFTGVTPRFRIVT